MKKEEVAKYNAIIAEKDELISAKDTAITQLKNRMHLVSSIANVNKTLARRLGIDRSIFSSHDGARDYDEIFGYPKSLDYATFMDSYMRGDIASRIIDAPVSAVWSSQPRIREKNKTEVTTEFNTKWEEICKKTNFWHYVRKADKLNRIGRFSVLFLGFSGGMDLSRPVSKNAKLEYVRPFSEGATQIIEYDGNINSPRYGKPVMYQINTNVDTLGMAKDSKLTSSIRVHYSRILHITEDSITSDIYGIPALQKVYNRLVDITKVVGGSAEMFWRGARPGYTAVADADSKFTDEDKEEMESQLEDFDNDLTRWLQLQGIKVDSLAQQIYTPEQHFKVLTACIASAVGIPQRILIGAESGELASSMDERNWNNRILERRKDFAEPNILNPLIQRLQELGQLPAVEYDILWEDLNTLTEKDKAEVAYKNSVAIMNFFNAPIALDIVGAEVFGRDIMQFPEEVVKKLVTREKEYIKLKKQMDSATLDKLKQDTTPNETAGDSEDGKTDTE